MDNKWCNGCKQSKPIEDFGKNKAKKDGRQTRCRVCVKTINAEYYKNTPERNPQRWASKERILTENRQLVFEYLNSHPCVDCGNSDWRVLEFDHTGDNKEKDVSYLMTGSSIKLLEEIAKCDVRCKNCHSIITYERAGSWRSMYMRR